MKLNRLNKKNNVDLNTEMLNLLREKLNLQTQKASGQLKQTHLLKKIRRDIARLKTFLTKLGSVFND